MARIKALDPATAEGKTKELFAAVQAKLGGVPNLLRTFGNSPAVLDAYLRFSGALAAGSLSVKQRELIALAVAEANACEYCLSAHTAVGKVVGLNDGEIEAGREASSTNPKTDAALKFARALVRARGLVTDGELNAVREAGWSDAGILEILATVVFNLFTNYTNHVARTDVDFPRVRPQAPKAAA